MQGSNWKRTCVVTYLKKSFLQKSFASLEKHLSCNAALQSKQRTHSTCHARSKTFSRYWSIIGFSHPAHDRSIARPRLPVEIKKGTHYTHLRHFFVPILITWRSVPLYKSSLGILFSFHSFISFSETRCTRIFTHRRTIRWDSTRKFRSKFNEILTHAY